MSSDQPQRITLRTHLKRIGALGRGESKRRGDAAYYRELALKSAAKKKQAQAVVVE